MVFFGFVVMNYQNFGGDRGSWVYNRIIIVRCDNVIPENRQDKQLVEHLLEEKEYIVSLAMRYLKQVINNGYKYNIPVSCKLLNTDYQTENHSFLLFMKECVIDREIYGRITDDCTTAKFYKVYEAWCIDNNNGYKESKKEVNKILNELGKGEIKKTNGGYTYYKAITLTEEAKQDYESIYYNLGIKKDFPQVDANIDDDIRKQLGPDFDYSKDLGNFNIGDFSYFDEDIAEFTENLNIFNNFNNSNNVVDIDNESV